MIDNKKNKIMLLSIFILIVSLTRSSIALSETESTPPRIAVVLHSGEGAHAGAAIGVLRALAEKNVPIDIIGGSGLSALVAALYATGHTYDEIASAINSLSDLYSPENAVSAVYPSDYRLRRLLTERLGCIDFLTDGDFGGKLPITFFTSALEIETGDSVVVNRGRLTAAVRAGITAPRLIEPLVFEGRTLVKNNHISADIARQQGADYVIAIDTIDRHDLKTQKTVMTKARILDSALDFSARRENERQAALADIVFLPDAINYAELSNDDLPAITMAGYKAGIAGSFMISERIKYQKVALQQPISYPKACLSAIEKGAIREIQVTGLNYIKKEYILKQFGIAPNVRFNLREVLNSLDRVYKSGYYQSVWLDFQRVEGEDVKIVLNVKESEASLPIETMPSIISDLDSTDLKVQIAAISILGGFGSRAIIAADRLSEFLKDKNADIRAVAADSLGKIGREMRVHIPDLVQALKIEKRLSVQLSVGRAIARIASQMRSLDDARAVPYLEEAVTAMNEYLSLSESTENTRSVIQRLGELLENQQSDLIGQYSFGVTETPPWLLESDEVFLNGQPTHLKIDRNKSSLMFLGPEAEKSLHPGMNRLSKGKESILYWFEEKKLTHYSSPYKNSYAIIAAIDDYDRELDGQKRGPTGFPKLDDMVVQAKELEKTLQKLGFPKNNIITLYNKAATSGNIETILKEFWKGGKYAQADRLFFYFGGHGGESDGAPYLVTYNYDINKPTVTSFMMQDFVRTYAQNIITHHVLFAIDACYSGLSVKTLGGQSADEERLKKIIKLTAIRRDIEPRARNILVAGTSDQKALWQNGGIFTIALIKALNGEGDLNGDGIIQFEEMGIYVRDNVTGYAGRTGVRQDPDFKVLDQFGTGRVMFFP